MEKLAEMGGAKDAPSIGWVCGSKHTLRGLIDAHAETLGDAPTICSGALLQGVESLRISVPAGSKYVTASRDDDDNSFESLNYPDFESLQLDTTQNGALSVSSDEQSQQGEPGGRMAGRVSASTFDTGGWDDSDDNDFEPLDGTQTQPAATTGSAILISDNPARADPEDDNLWLKVGGGLAVLGAVVGGVALLATQNGGDDSRDRRGQNGNSGSRPSS
jgi:hypothetical protein